MIEKDMEASNDKQLKAPYDPSSKPFQKLVDAS
jgi:hypothetical protein